MVLTKRTTGINGLYQLIGGDRNTELRSTDLTNIIKGNGFSKCDKERLLVWLDELKFWEEYSKIYSNLEKSRPYDNLSDSIKEMLQPQKADIWLDAGCGPLRVSELIFDKSKGEVRAIEGVDIVLEPARQKLAKLLEKHRIHLPVNLTYASMTDPLPYPDDFFDGIGANLILSYVVDFLGMTGKAALESVLREMFRLLKPGGHLVWSTPKYKVQFAWVFLASLPDMLNIYEYIAHKDVTRILQGTRILKHALAIQRKGKEGIYTFLPKDELESLLKKIGFVNLAWKKTFAQQVWVNRAYKPQ